MKRGLQGQYVTISTSGESAQAFIPNPLPPDPPIIMVPKLQSKFTHALVALGRLDAISDLLPNPDLILSMYARKEAVLSSMIEGTQSSLSDLLMFELNEKATTRLDDVREVYNYSAALSHGLTLLNKLPLSSRLLREIHTVLMRKTRGSDKGPGEFRRSQNWLGGTRPGNAIFVPPTAQALPECIKAFEEFLNDPETEPLIKAALAHLQFETIHPFLDGNGRIGRLLITLILCEQKILRKPILYLSFYFKTHRRRYYELLNHVRFTGDWEIWLDFFADAVLVTAGQVWETVQELLGLFECDLAKINKLGRQAPSARQIHHALMEFPYSTSPSLVQKTSLSAPTVNKALVNLKRLGIVNELTGDKRNRIFVYDEYMNIMNRDMELPEDEPTGIASQTCTPN